MSRYLSTAKKVLVGLHQEDSGQDLIEYALIAALIALAATFGMGSVAQAINDAFSSIGAKTEDLHRLRLTAFSEAVPGPAQRAPRPFTSRTWSALPTLTFPQRLMRRHGLGRIRPFPDKRRPGLVSHRSGAGDLGSGGVYLTALRVLGQSQILQVVPE